MSRERDALHYILDIKPSSLLHYPVFELVKSAMTGRECRVKAYTQSTHLESRLL